MTERPYLVDLFCGAGGATRGYQDAGFFVKGVDIDPQPNYCGDVFLQADLTELSDLDWWGLLDGAFAVHASPPCQAFTAYRRTGKVGEYPDLIATTRKRLNDWGGPWVMENVEGAPLDPVATITICGTMFDPPMEVQRHRLFESNLMLAELPWPCRHKLNGPDRYPGGRSKQRTGSSRGLVRRTVEIGSWDIPLRKQQEAMGVDWMTLPELSESIPPAYTEWIGFQVAQWLREQGQIPA